MPTEWQRLVLEARRKLGTFFRQGGASEDCLDAGDQISLFENATRALSRVLHIVGRCYERDWPILLTTDLEYPGCLAAIEDTWRGTIVVARVAEMVRAGPDDMDALLEDALVTAYNLVKPGVVFLSHVSRVTGQQLSSELVHYFRERNADVIIVVDGSQAVGNTVISEDLLECVDFYVGSGHKWLGGMPTSGFAWRRDALRWTVDDPSQSLTGVNEIASAGNGIAWASLIASSTELLERGASVVAEHNVRLGCVFIEALASVRDIVRVITPCGVSGPPTGLVAVAIDHASRESVAAGLRHDGFGFTMLGEDVMRFGGVSSACAAIEWESGAPSVRRAGANAEIWQRLGTDGVFRFCFHYWHTEDDVRRLAASVLRSVEADAAEGVGQIAL